MTELNVNTTTWAWTWKMLLVVALFFPTCNGNSCGDPVAVRGCDTVREGLHTVTSSRSVS